MNDNIYRFINKNKGKIIGGIVGLLIAIIIVAFGFWKGIFIILSVIAGIYIGGRIESQGDLQGFLNKSWFKRERY